MRHKALALLATLAALASGCEYEFDIEHVFPPPVECYQGELPENVVCDFGRYKAQVTDNEVVVLGHCNEVEYALSEIVEHLDSIGAECSEDLFCDYRGNKFKVTGMVWLTSQPCEGW